MGNWTREYALQVLGLPQYATADMVKKAYRQLCKKYHPDDNANEYAVDAYLLIQAAYEFLCANPGQANPFQASGMPTDGGVVWNQNTGYTNLYGNSGFSGTVRRSKIIGTGTNPVREKCFEQVQRGSQQMEELERRRKEQERKETERLEREAEFVRSVYGTRLEQEKKKREIESQYYRLMEVLQMIQAENQQEEIDNDVYAKKRAYEAFRKYEERKDEI